MVTIVKIALQKILESQQASNVTTVQEDHQDHRSALLSALATNLED